MAVKKKAGKNKAYNSKYGVIAGYLPQDIKHIGDWFKQLKQEMAKEKKQNGFPGFHPSVQALSDLIYSNGIVRMYVTRMIEEVPPPDNHIKSIAGLLETLNFIIGRAPRFNVSPAKRNTFPMSTLFVYMMFTEAGEAAFRNEAFNSALRNILQAWCDYLDSTASRDVLNTGAMGWLSPPAVLLNNLDEFVIPDINAPYWGFASYNAFFHREIKKDKRPLAGPGDSKVIVSANDGTVFKISRKVKWSDTFWIKSQPYSLVNMLNNSIYTEKFLGGDVFQSFLSGANYHRWHSPVDGTLVDWQVVNGLQFSELQVEGFDKDAGVLSQGYETSVNTRGLMFIQANDPAIGLVCVIPVGITEISSIKFSANLVKGMPVKKGQELGRFSYGGSTLCLVFQPGAIKKFTVQGPSKTNAAGDNINVNAQIAVAN